MGEKLGALAVETEQIATGANSLCDLCARPIQVKQAASSNLARVEWQGNGSAVEG